jgi:outer membrane lipoprotein carrier protein
MTHRLIKFFLAAVFLLGCWPGIGRGMEAGEIIDRVQQRYGRGFFEADFFQKSNLKAMDIVDTAQGHLYFGRPGSMRWHYKSPEEYFIITDGVSVWMYRPEDNQVILGRAADYFGSKKGADFFTNPGELTKAFIVEAAPKDFQREDCHALKLIPKTERAELTELYVFVSKTTFDIEETLTCNAFGDRTTLRFTGYRFDPGLNDELFTFEIPPGAEVVELESE